jgi:hypothetical protein
MSSLAGKSAFVAMPFAERFDELYSRGIAGAAADVGLELIRLGRLPVNHIVRQMEAEIGRCDLTIAVATGRNPHVFFEIALAYATRKPCIVMAEREEDFEIFRQAYPCLIYDGDTMQLRRRLKEELVRLMAQ